MDRTGRGHERVIREFLKLRKELGDSDALIAENQRLRNEAAMYRLLLYEVSEPALYSDAAFNIIYANRAAVVLLSPASSILGIKLPDLFIEEDREKVREASQMALNGAAVSIRPRSIANGAPMALRLRPCFGPSNDISGVLAAGEPSSAASEGAQKELLKEICCLEERLSMRTAELIEANEQLLVEMDASEKAEGLARDFEAAQIKLLDMISDAVFAADASDGRILSANRSASLLLKKPANEITGIHFTELHPPELADECIRKFRFILETGHGSDIRLPVRDSEGNSLPVSIDAFTAVVGDRTVAYGVFRDLSGLGRRDGERRRTNFIEGLYRMISGSRAVPA